MHRRCQDASNPVYGGRGISVCERWASFENFLEDMGVRPIGCTIDRIDPNGHYTPENCRWAPDNVQQRNRRSCRYISHNNETLSLVEWAERLGCKYSTLRMRLEKGWSVERTLTTPVEFRRQRAKRGAE